MTVNGPFIHIEGLVKSYQGPSGQVEVLKGLDLRVEAGESVGVLGASGVGKSTLLHIVGALDRPSAGRVKVAGWDISEMDEARLADFRNRHVGFVFQFHHLLPEFSALENVMMPALISRADPGESRKKSAALLEEVGLSHRLEHLPSQLSGGEQQRVALARALVMEPLVLLADEPTGNLDEKTGRMVHELLARLNREKGLTTLVATHNENLASMLARRVRLADGKAMPRGGTNLPREKEA